MEEANDDAFEALADVEPADALVDLELGNEVGGALDWAGDELGEEGDVEGEGYEVFGGGHLAAIDANSVAQGLERVEGDACWEEYLPGLPVAICSAEPLEEADDVFGGEVEILEIEEQSDIGDDADGDEQAALGDVLGAADDDG